MVFTDLNLHPPVFLAPMAGVTDAPSREIAQLFSPGLVVSEMIASSGKNKPYFEKLVKANLGKVGSDALICPTSIQIAGHEQDWMSYAAKVIEFEGGSVIDLNMGCPAKSIVGKLAGSALMKEPKHALKIIESVVNSTDLPVTLKMRLGWDENTINAPAIAKSAEDSGVQMITIHARTRNQFFKGKPNWSLVKLVKNAVSIPVIINGDIVDSESARLAVANSFADGVMVGRGAIGKPWVLKDISKSLYGKLSDCPGDFIPLCDLIILHFDKILSYYGVDVGVKMFRKHLAAYSKSIVLSSSHHTALMTEESIYKLERMITITFDEKKIEVLRR